MPNLANVIKVEIARISRKEARSETTPLQLAVTKSKRDIALLKRQVEALHKQLHQTQKALAKIASSSTALKPTTKGVNTASEPETTGKSPKVRFSAERLKAHREKLSLSAQEYGQLVGASGQSIYKWETERAFPRARQLAGIAEVFKLSKAQARKKLDELTPAA